MPSLALESQKGRYEMTRWARQPAGALRNTPCHVMQALPPDVAIEIPLCPAYSGWSLSLELAHTPMFQTSAFDCRIDCRDETNPEKPHYSFTPDP